MRRTFQFATILLWLALPVVSLQYREVWDQLPTRMATHFNAAGQANGWMSRDQALNFGVGFTALLLVIFTFLLLYMSRSRVDAFSWSMLAFTTFVLGFMVVVNRSIVEYNLRGEPLHLDGLLIFFPIAVVLLIGVYIASRREPPFPSMTSGKNELLAEETHSGGWLALLVLPAAIGPAIAAALVPITAFRIAMTISALVGVAAVAAAWSGFHYRFFSHGVEISILGIRLRSIPRQQILSYAPESWNLFRGYGIRGVGKTQAYVWGDQVVHIKTNNGDIYLGANDAQRTVRELDRVMHN